MLRDTTRAALRRQAVIRTQQPAQHEQNAQQTAEQDRDERSEQDWTTRAGVSGVMA
jgi:hypothetical protein